MGINALELDMFTGLWLLSTTFKLNDENINASFVTDRTGRDIFSVLSTYKYSIDDVSNREQRTPFSLMLKYYNIRQNITITEMLMIDLCKRQKYRISMAWQ